MDINGLRDDIAIAQKKGLPFIIASCFIWALITVVSVLDISMDTKNLLVFCCACPMLPISWIVGKILKVDIFAKQNPLGELGFLFTINQLLYLLIVMWVFNAVPDKMIMVYAMVFGAHLLPYSWLYRSTGYMVCAIAIPIVSLALGLLLGGSAVAAALTVLEVLFAVILLRETKGMPRQ